MTVSKQASQSSTIVLTETMSSQPSTSKRKTPDDGSPLDGMLTKKARKEKPKSATAKRKLVGEEQPGGLVIVRAPSTRPPSNPPPSLSETQAHQRPPSRSASVQPSQQHPPNANAAKPPSKKFRADTTDTTAQRTTRGREREPPPGLRSEPEMDEDVRQMQSETNNLRHQKSRVANGAINPAFQFPTELTTPENDHRIRPVMEPIAASETPQILRNKIMRGEAPHPRRKSSISRGKRASTSFENTGVITQPHTSVSESMFYKHIDVDLPEPQRAQQLLIWCANRAMNDFVDEHAPSSSSRRNVASAGKDPPLSPEDIQLLKSVQEEVIRMLAEKKIDTNVSGKSASVPPPERTRTNEQNVRNRARETKFNEHIQRSKMEKEVWSELDNFYKQHRLAVITDLEKRERELSLAAKLKGKQRATLEDIEKWEADLPQHFEHGVSLARNLVGSGLGMKVPLSERIEDVEYTADRVHGLSHSALQTTRMAEADLDRRFARLSILLASRSQSLPSTLGHSATALSSYLPTSLSRPPPTTDPQDLLRALSRADAERPQSQVGDAARRAAREVQRAHDAGVGMTERRLTVAPPTPRKPPGTPRRANTPGRAR